MLDNYQSRVGPDEYYISFSGTLSECQAVKTIPDKQKTWEKRDYSDCHRVEDHPLGAEPGGIYELTLVANFAAKLDLGPVLKTVRRPKLPDRSELILLVAASAGVGLAIGLLLGFRLGGDLSPCSTPKGGQ
jgi:hypothetical protein